MKISETYKCDKCEKVFELTGNQFSHDYGLRINVEMRTAANFNNIHLCDACFMQLRDMIQMFLSKIPSVYVADPSKITEESMATFKTAELKLGAYSLPEGHLNNVFDPIAAVWKIEENEK